MSNEFDIVITAFETWIKALEEPNWIVKVVVGVIFGLSLPYVLRALKWPILIFRKHVLRKNWWEYHYSTRNNINQMFESSLQIRASLTGTLVFKLDQEETDLKYKGKVLTEKGTDLVVLSGKSLDPENEENIILRYHFPNLPNCEIITGIYSAYSQDKKPYASIGIISKDRIGLEKAAAIIDRVTIDTKGLPLLRVKKNTGVNNIGENTEDGTQGDEESGEKAA